MGRGFEERTDYRGHAYLGGMVRVFTRRLGFHIRFILVDSSGRVNWT